LVGDELYGGKATGEPFKLRAVKVAFTHMRTGERIEVSC
jgi:23S rRNA pseudouridine1911/1915/1917 synthase